MPSTLKLNKKIFRVGIVGLGGYARSHHDAILRLEQAGEVRLICTCDPAAKAFVDERHAWNFRQRGVQVFEQFDEMLAACVGQLDLVIISAPIQYHLDMHRSCVEAGVACYMEKPPTLVYSELEEMIRVDEEAEKKTLVGFNYISEPQRLALKERLVRGEFGRLESASLQALWSRDTHYFQRNNWGGKLMHEGKLVLDSCFGNAISHFVHNMLFWTGTDQLFSWGEVGSVRAELYRANLIESADTFFVETMASDVRLRFAVSHACREEDQQTETLHCERATIRYVVGRHFHVAWKDGREEVAALNRLEIPYASHTDYLRYLRGQTARPATTLVDCRPVVHLNDLAFISSGTIDSFPPERLTTHPHGHTGVDTIVVSDMASLCHHFIESGTWPQIGERYLEPGPRTVSPRDLPKLNEVILDMVQAPSLETEDNAAAA